MAGTLSQRIVVPKSFEILPVAARFLLIAKAR
jgi:hypothetical protein